MNEVLKVFSNNENIQEIIKATQTNKFNLSIKNCPQNHKLMLACALFDKRSVVLISENTYKATKEYDAISKIIGYENVNLYIINDVVASEVDATNKDFEYERLNTLFHIVKQQPKVIVTNLVSVLKELMPFQLFKKSILKLKINDIVKREELLNALVKLGYFKVPTTNDVGFFSVRGEVVDIFPINTDKAIRINFFDDQIERIRYYNTVTQLSESDIDEVEIYPHSDFVYDNGDEIKNNIIKTIFEYDFYLEKDLNDIENYNYSDRICKYYHYMYDHTESILDYIDNPIIIFNNNSDIKLIYEKTIGELFNYMNSKISYKELDLSFYFDFYKLALYDNLILCDEFVGDNIISKNNYKDFVLHTFTIPSYHNNIKLLLEDINKTKQQIFLSFTSDEKIKLIKEILDDKAISYNKKDSKIKIIKACGLSFGFINGASVIDEENIYKTILKRAVYRSSKINSTPISSKKDLKPGEYIVHYEYGIGQYLGIKSITMNDICNDYIYIKFANIELGIPVENINLIERFQGEEGYIPKLTNVGSGEWEKKKTKIKEQVNNIAKELLLLHAYRESKSGFIYALDEDIQEKFESDFEYTETPDQITAINDIKKDMESGKIIDRLICGDVGYGKTEVAIRIAMKTVLNGKQVAFLAPTTILTRQHYYSFKERMEKYGVNVAVLNRLIGSKEKKEILEKIKNGKIDVLIGTHILLNDKIKFKDLGLLIIDEEQRFGVAHKEKIKQYKNNVNVLTLTATPIPRTLQMAIIGARQISVIETSPANRYPVQTFVLQKNKTVIKEAIYNELARGGQIFYMHNEIRTLDLVYRNLSQLVPEARIVIAHGQMYRDDLENAIQKYIDHEYDLLLCTSIIETGIDMPNANTLIVDDAHRLGLSQMYQIRGRVGRSDRIAYAYFMYEYESAITSEGIKRLNALREFTSLGSGYNIALRDLAIRGAGNFLGKEQSGYIDNIGMDLYIKMLNESMHKIESIESKNNEKIDNIEISKHVEDRYVSDDDTKIYIHKLINQIDSKEMRDKVAFELEDRFGKLPNLIKDYINKQYMDILASNSGVQEISENEFKVKVVFTIDKTNEIPAKQMMKLVYELGDDYSMQYMYKRYIIYILKVFDKTAWIYKMIDLLEGINKLNN